MMKRKFLSLLTAAVMVLGISVPVMAEEEPSLDGKLVIVHTNDMHGYFETTETSIGMAGIAGLRDDFKAKGADVLLLDAGDFSQGRTLVSYYKGKNAAEYIAASQYDLVSLGNHEFDYAFDTLVDNMQVLIDAGVKVVDANVIDKSTGKPYFDPHAIFDFDGFKVGVFGLDTAETLTKATPSNVKYVDFLDKEEMFECAQKEVDFLKAEGCDYIIAVTHLGVDEESIGRRSIDVAEKVKGIDLMIDGHSHTEMPGGQMVGDTLITSAGCYLANAGLVYIDEETKEAKAELINAADYAANIGIYNEEIAAIVNEDVEEVANAYSEVFAKTEVPLEGTKALVRSQETNLGDFTADAYLYAGNKYADEHELGFDVDVAISNGGGIRASVEPGEISMNTLATVFPFGNSLCLVTITGEQLLNILEASTFVAPETLGGFPQVAGVEFKLNLGVPFEKGEQYPDSTYFAPAKPGSRVTIKSVAGKPFNPAANYTVAVNSFQAEGGDTYYELTQNSYFTDTELLDRDALIDYVNSLNGVIGQQYAAPQGRIEIVNEPAEVPAIPVEPQKPAVPEVPEVKPEVPAPLPEGGKYIVVEGDNLWKIADSQLGNGTLWTKIYEDNKTEIKNPNLIYAGQELEIKK